MNNNILIGIVEDNPVNRNSFMQKIQQFPELELSLVATNGEEYLEKLQGLPIEKQPELVFMDIQMPKLSGIETIKLASAHSSKIKYVVLTVFDDESNIFEAIQAGAVGYLLKHENYFSIRDIIKEVLEFGGSPMSPAIARKTLEFLSKVKTEEVSDDILGRLLTEREREVLMHLVNGYDSKRIGELMKINTLTVRKHIANIYSKLHVNSKAQVISLAHKNKWI